ncbi:unnamed protein product [Schistocephalus solidus]|uniref:Uncharacterized protein n=1 Tax=Schistocephalus solidus TaxID=70667 RepID=A0A183T6S0_SCHSO|nr:unnamed protein product [Schistocephalus solidus]
MHQPRPNTIYTAAFINVNGAQLKSADTLTFLGSNLSRSTKVDDEIAHRITKASQVVHLNLSTVSKRNASSGSSFHAPTTLREKAFRRMSVWTNFLCTLKG